MGINALVVVLVTAVGGACSSHGTSAPSIRPTTLVPVEIVTALSSDAARVVLVRRFIGAYNAADAQAVLALMSDDPAVSDCDYKKVSVIELRGRPAVTAWLVARFADHDQLTPATIENGNPDPGSSAIGVVFAHRTSDTLRQLGFADGVKPQLETKIRFTGSGDGLRIETFALGPGGGPPTPCQPT